MNNFPALPSQGASLPVAFDYPAALALRQMAMVYEEMPRYLLAPEVSALLHYVPDLQRKMLLATLWNSGARINEALALPGRFFADVITAVRTAGNPETARGESRADTGRKPCASPGAAVGSSVRHPAADDGGHPENPTGSP